ncbi:MAG: S8 family serine peptidase [Actinomycetota bacterium]|nr:S8 family serine peptidase [Actinomycetota bacterium]
MPGATIAEQYVLLPMRGLRPQGAGATAQASEFLRSLGEGSHAVRAAGREVALHVIDAIGADGARLVEVPSGSVAAIRGLEPGLRLVRVVYYAPATKQRERVVTAPEQAVAAGAVTLRVVSGEGGEPVAGAIVVAFTNYGASVGAQGVTDAEGMITLELGGSSVKLDRLYFYPTTALWSLLQKSPTVSDGSEVKLRPIDLDYTDGLRHYYGNGPQDAGTNVTVAVVDTGVGPHPDLVVDGGANTVPGEDPDDFASNGILHGTHVAGIVAARGTPPPESGGWLPVSRCRPIGCSPEAAGWRRASPSRRPSIRPWPMAAS